MRANLWETLKTLTDVAIDSFSVRDFEQFSPYFGTCNPTIVRNHFLNGELANHTTFEDSELSVEKAIVLESLPILQAIPGPYAVQVNPFFANNQSQTVHNAHYMIKLYEAANIPKERILIKIPATWAGIQAAKELEKEGIKCILTAVFSLAQSQAAANASVYMVAPYLARIQEAYKAKEKHKGVELVENMHNQALSLESSTQILAAGFRTAEEVFSVANLPCLTLKPKIAFELQSMEEIPLVYRYHELEMVEPANTESIFAEQLSADPIAEASIQKTLNSFRFAWLNLKKLVQEKRGQLAAL